MVPRRKSRLLSAVQRMDLFGPPELLEGEDPMAFAALRDHVYAAIAPVDIIDEIFAHDFVLSEWENRRWRRHICHRMNEEIRDVLKKILNAHLNLDAYERDFEQSLKNILAEHMPVDEAKALAHRCLEWGAKAFDQVEKVLDKQNQDVFEIEDDAKRQKAKEIAQAYARGEPKAIKQVEYVLASVGTTIDKLIATELAHADHLSTIERLNGLLMDAVARRNTSLRELDRHRTLRGHATLVTVRSSEDDGFRAIESTSAKQGAT